MIKDILMTSLVDYPGNISSVVFVGGCNFRCGFCYNKVLVLEHSNMKNMDVDEVLVRLERRRKLIDGVVVTGGEPCLWSGLEDFCRKVKKMGLKVKVDTNGTRPLVLKELYGQGLVDYIAMDVKAPFAKYSSVCGINFDLDSVRKSIHFLITSGVEHEFRCTVHSSLLSCSDMLEVARQVEGGSKLCFQIFKDLDVIDNSLKGSSVYDKEEFDRVVNECGRLIRVEVRH